MSLAFVKFHDVTFRYESAAEPLFQNLALHIVSGWSGVVGANGTGKTTLLKLATGQLEPDEGHIDSPRNAVYCSQRTDDVPKNFNALLVDPTKTAQLLKGQLGIQADWQKRWSTLSHGERKRAQIAVALWLKPDVLAIDEPTNHVDAEAREIITRALHEFKGIGLLVSHDRELLDALCLQCVFVEPPAVITRPGGITKGMRLAKAEQHALQKQQILKKREYKRLHREADRRRTLAQQARKKRSKHGLARKDHDAKEKIDRARISGKDAVGGKLLRQLHGRLNQVGQQIGAIQVKKEYTVGIWLPGSRSKRNLLWQLSEGFLELGECKRLYHPDLVILPEDRIAITGPNGAGKSTLIRHIVQTLNISTPHITYVPQEIDVHQSQDILTQGQTLPGEQLGHLMTIVSRLGSRPHRLLESTEPSPGEIRKLLLALGMTRLPHIIIMDEPTNHMDLPSIECLEQALAECPCCVVLVSHDTRFLETLTQTTWQIRRNDPSDGTYTLHVIA